MHFQWSEKPPNPISSAMESIQRAQQKHNVKPPAAHWIMGTMDQTMWCLPKTCKHLWLAFWIILAAKINEHSNLSQNESEKWPKIFEPTDKTKAVVRVIWVENIKPIQAYWLIYVSQVAIIYFQKQKQFKTTTTTTAADSLWNFMWMTCHMIRYLSQQQSTKVQWLSQFYSHSYFI